MSHPIRIYQSPDGQVQLDIRLEQDTLWLSQSQISALFDTSTDNISLHLKNIYAEQELDEKATAEDFSVVRQEGKRQVRRKLKDYSLDGNKRSSSLLFLWYLRMNQNLLAKPVEQLINDNTLVAVALLVAESQPKRVDDSVA